MMSLEQDLVHSIAETLINISSLVGLEFFIIFQDQTLRRFAGSDSLTKQFLKYQLTPFASDIQLQKSSKSHLDEISIENQSHRLKDYVQRDAVELEDFFGGNYDDSEFVKIEMKKEEGEDSMEEDCFSENSKSDFESTKREDIGLIYSKTGERTTVIPEQPFVKQCKNPQSSENLKSMPHIRNEDQPAPEISKCDRPKSFEEKTKFKTRLQTHARDKPFNCLQCPKSFKDFSQIRSHTIGGKPLHKQTRTKLPLRQRIEVIDFIESGKKQVEAVKHFSLHRATVNAIWKRKEKYRTDFRQSKNPNAKSNIKSPFLAVEEPLIKWIQHLQENIPVSGPLIQQKAIEMGKKLGFQNFEASNGWLARFKKTKQHQFLKIMISRGN